jgi:hypothetical protein
MKFSKYFLNLLAATILPSVLAAVAVVTCSVLTGLLNIGVTAATYQRIGAASPFVLQTLFGLLMGLLLSKRIGDVKSAQWVWVIPVTWMLFGIVIWRPVVVPNLSPWEYFFSAQWLQLPPSLLRSRWVTDQFTHTVPLFTSVAYSVGAFVETQRFGEGRELATHNLR